MKTTVFAFVCLLFLFSSCSKKSSNSNGSGNGSPTDCSTVPKSFSTNVFPIIQNSCAISGCHNAGSVNGPGPLTNYTQVFNARNQIRTAVANGTMPKTGSLTTAQKNSIICWIDSGAPNN